MESTIKRLALLVLVCFISTSVAGGVWGEEKSNINDYEKAQKLALFLGNYSSFGIQGNLFFHNLNLSLNGSIYFKKSESLDADVMGIEIGPNLISKQIFDNLMFFAGISIGNINYSSGVSGWVVSYSENYTYITCNLTLLFRTNNMIFYFELEPLSSPDKEILLKFGIGI